MKNTIWTTVFWIVLLLCTLQYLFMTLPNITKVEGGGIGLFIGSLIPNSIIVLIFWFIKNRSEKSKANNSIENKINNPTTPNNQEIKKVESQSEPKFDLAVVVDEYMELIKSLKSQYIKMNDEFNASCETLDGLDLYRENDRMNFAVLIDLINSNEGSINQTMQNLCDVLFQSIKNDSEFKYKYSQISLSTIKDNKTIFIVNNTEGFKQAIKNSMLKFDNFQLNIKIVENIKNQRKIVLNALGLE